LNTHPHTLLLIGAASSSSSSSSSSRAERVRQRVGATPEQWSKWQIATVRVVRPYFLISDWIALDQIVTAATSVTLTEQAGVRAQVSACCHI
jgi:hypothetical protein